MFAARPFMRASNWAIDPQLKGSICVPLPAILSARIATHMSIRGGSRSNASRRGMVSFDSFVRQRLAELFRRYGGVVDTSRK